TSGLSMRALVIFVLAPMLLAMCLGSPGSAFGQEVTASFTGSIVDPSGAAVVGATLTAKDKDRGTTYEAKTNDVGVFSLLRLPVGTYDLQVEAPGFQTAVYHSVILVLNQTARVDFQLKVGQANESMEVTSLAPLLQTDSVQLSTVMDADSNVNLPLLSRNYIQLTLLAPGSVHPDPSTLNSGNDPLSASRPYINGNREQANNFLLDGMDNNEVSDNLVGYTPSVDAIQEFNIITQNASAEFGNYQGGIVSATVKSGRNRFYGNLFEFFRNDKFKSNNAANGWTKGVVADEGSLGHAADGTGLIPELRYNQFGATFGGPIVKDKLFFFLDYQGIRQVTADSDGAQVLTPAMKGGDFSSFCQTGFTAGLCNDKDSKGNRADQLVN